MDAVEYLKEKQRLTKGKCATYLECLSCRLNSNNNTTGFSCSTLERNNPEKAVEIVENWAKENPVKTYLSVLLEKFPNAPLNNHGTPKFCPTAIWDNANCIRIVDCVLSKSCNMCDCWKQEYREEE